MPYRINYICLSTEAFMRDVKSFGTAPASRSKECTYELLSSFGIKHGTRDTLCDKGSIITSIFPMKI